jgi:hypothetical protein
MGSGLYALINPNDRNGSKAIWGFAAAGAIGGVALTERYAEPDRDAGRTASRLRFTPGSLVLAAAGVPGRFPILNVAF